MGAGFGTIDFFQIERLSQDAQSSQIPRRATVNATLADEHKTFELHLDLPSFVATGFSTGILVEGKDSKNELLCFLRCFNNFVNQRLCLADLRNDPSGDGSAEDSGSKDQCQCQHSNGEREQLYGREECGAGDKKSNAGAFAD